MRIIHDGDLLTSTAEALVNPVNTVGVMGKGLALAFRRAHPDSYAAYRTACGNGELRVGKVFPTRR
ncbi:MAG TPA: macro domain-containing protein, partial [Gammaproteobacteria bacterium]|nr:macro domain-containing protein [Gammaproteobacteria bacterium]